MTHELKTWPEFFQAVKSGRKTFEIRKNDRPFSVGDLLNLSEFYPSLGYTGEVCFKRVSYLLTGPEAVEFGVSEGYALMGLESTPPSAPEAGEDSHNPFAQQISQLANLVNAGSERLIELQSARVRALEAEVEGLRKVLEDCRGIMNNAPSNVSALLGIHQRIASALTANATTGKEGQPLDLCDKCMKNPAQEIHSCPYNHDINGDDSDVCDCCDECIDNCKGDI